MNELWLILIIWSLFGIMINWWLLGIQFPMGRWRFIIPIWQFILIIKSQGIGLEIMKCMEQWYRGFHQQQVVADGKAAAFDAKCGFKPSGDCQAMWIYHGHEHG